MRFRLLPRRKRLSDKLDLVVIALQAIFFARIIILLVGIWDHGAAAHFIRATDLVVRPFYSLMPPAQVGPYILDSASAALMIALSLGIVAAEKVADRARLLRTARSRAEETAR